jgi:hypothetical protein
MHYKKNGTITVVLVNKNNCILVADNNMTADIITACVQRNNTGNGISKKRNEILKESIFWELCKMYSSKHGPIIKNFSGFKK